MFNKAEEAKEETQKQTATETMNLKITNIQISSYTENKELPSLQFLADKLCEDNDMEYVLATSKAHASLNKIDTTNISSIYTKLKKYPYEFEINSSLQLASIDGVKIANNTPSTEYVKKSDYDALLARVVALENNSDNTSTNNVFSETEQIIGTWIDGKPIYRKVINGISFTPASYAWTTSTVSIENIDRVIKCGLGQDGSIIYSFLGNKDNNKIKVWNCLPQSYTYQIMVVEYTKTTDISSITQ